MSDRSTVRVISITVMDAFLFLQMRQRFPKPHTGYIATKKEKTKGKISSSPHEYFKPVKAPRTGVLRKPNVELPAHPLKPGLIPWSISILSLSDGPNFGGFLSTPGPRGSKESALSRLIAHLNSGRRS